MRLRISLLLVFALALALPITALATGSGTPPVGTSAQNTDLSAVDGAVPYQGGYAIPLKGERPAWYTDELSAQVHAAGGQPVAAPGDAPLPGEVGIRPGSWILEPYGCTANFIFQSGGSYAIGTAGHCVDANGQSVVLLTVAPGGANPVLVDVGTVITFRNNGIGDDFALVSIRPELNAWVFPTMAVVGGP